MLLIKRCCSSFRSIRSIIKTNKPGDKLEVHGWVQNIRRLKNNLFLDINDGSTCEKLQILVPKTDATKSITAGSSIKAVGCIQVAPNGNYELHAKDVTVRADGNINAGYPFTPKQQYPPEYVRDHLHLRTRVDYIAATMRLRHKAQKAIHDYMDNADFVQINTPILSTNDCEGAGEVFTVQADSEALRKEMARPGQPLEQCYFDAKVFLTVSGQLHLEAMTYGLGNTYTFSPAFRAENCKSPLHLSEFYMYEAELAFMDDICELSTFIEKMIKSITTSVLENSAEDLAFCQKKVQGAAFDLPWIRKTWHTLTYNEALDIIQNNKQNLKTEIKPNEGFSKEQEMFLVEHCGAPVFVVNWPAEHKPFYMKVSRENPNIVNALDLLMPSVGELCGGSLREYDAKRMRQNPNFPIGLEWYIQLREFGGIPTGGFGMGFERYLQLLTGIKNIRDVIPFPRYPHSCKM